MQGVLWLINNDRSVAVSEEYNENRCTSLAMGKALDWRIIAVVRLLELDVKAVWHRGALRFENLLPEVTVLDIAQESGDAGAVDGPTCLRDLGCVSAKHRSGEGEWVNKLGNGVEHFLFHSGPDLQATPCRS